jgi:hypothetical protein
LARFAFILLLVFLVSATNTLIPRLVGVDDISRAAGGTGSAETFSYTAEAGLTLAIAKPDASSLNFRTSQGGSARSVAVQWMIMNTLLNSCVLGESLCLGALVVKKRG